MYDIRISQITDQDYLFSCYTWIDGVLTQFTIAYSDYRRQRRAIDDQLHEHGMPARYILQDYFDDYFTWLGS